MSLFRSCVLTFAFFLVSLVVPSGAASGVPSNRTIGLNDTAVIFSSGWSIGNFSSDSGFGSSFAFANDLADEVIVELPTNTVAMYYIGFKRSGGALYAACLDCELSVDQQRFEEVNAHRANNHDDSSPTTLFSFAGLDPSVQHALSLVNLQDPSFSDTSQITFVAVIATVLENDDSPTTTSALTSSTSISVLSSSSRVVQGTLSPTSIPVSTATSSPTSSIGESTPPVVTTSTSDDTGTAQIATATSTFSSSSSSASASGSSPSTSAGTVQSSAAGVNQPIQSLSTTITRVTHSVASAASTGQSPTAPSSDGNQPNQSSSTATTRVTRSGANSTPPTITITPVGGTSTRASRTAGGSGSQGVTQSGSSGGQSAAQSGSPVSSDFANPSGVPSGPSSSVPSSSALPGAGSQLPGNSGSSEGSSGLSQTTIVVVAVVSSLAVLAVLGAIFLLLRRARNRLPSPNVEDGEGLMREGGAPFASSGPPTRPPNPYAETVPASVPITSLYSHMPPAPPPPVPPRSPMRPVPQVTQAWVSRSLRSPT